MKIHIGEKCIVCGKTFTETDDVVVCPECGTPYHRACWQEHNACINQKLHETLLYNISMIGSYLEFAVTILLGLFGNRLYYRFVLRRVHKTVQEDVSPTMRRIRLRQEGGVSGWNILAVFGIQLGASMILGLVLMLLLAVL